MPFDEGVAQRPREVFEGREDIIERKTFGGIAFGHHGNMCCGIVNDVLMDRVGPDECKAALARAHSREMDFTGKSLTGFVYVDTEGFLEDDGLRDWVAMCEQSSGGLPAS